MTIKQIVTGQYRSKGSDNLGFAVIGLGSDDVIYEWNRSKTVWEIYDNSKWAKKYNKKDEESF